MSDARTKITVQLKLDCGCWVEHGVACQAGPLQFEKTMRLASDMLPHWLTREELAHKCELVSEDNPNGEAQAH